MNKSNENNEVEELEELPEVDYSVLPKDIEEALNEKPYVIEKKAKLTWDGRQFIVRIPSEITQEKGITKENVILFTLTKPKPTSDDNPELTIQLI